MKSMNKQKGSAHVAIVIVLIVALLGALGFIFWQNFIRNEPATKKTEAVNIKSSDSDKVADSNSSTLYENDIYSFEYLSDDWRVDEDSYDVDNPNDKTPVARTENYKAAVGMGIDTGAYVAVYVNKADQSLSDMKENAQKYQGEIKNLSNLTIAGEDAFTYSSGYEGMRYHTIFIHNGLSYDLVYQYAGDDELVYMDGYKKVANSFKFK